MYSDLYYSILPCRLDIGLFGLLGMLAVSVGPLLGRIVDRLVPWYAALVSTVLLVLFQAIQTGAGGINIAAVIVACFGLDTFRQMQQVSLTTSVFTQVKTSCCAIISLADALFQDISGCSLPPQRYHDHFGVFLFLRGFHCHADR